MQLYERHYLDPLEFETIGVSSKEDDIQTLLNKSHSFFLIADDEKIFGLGGIIITGGMISETAYVWFILRKQKYSKAQIKTGLLLARNYLSGLPWRMYAEVSLTDPVAEAFAISVGFHLVQKLDDRKLMKWGE